MIEVKKRVEENGLVLDYYRRYDGRYALVLEYYCLAGSGVLHRVDGYAVIRYSCSGVRLVYACYENGLLHNENGWALCDDDRYEYYMYGKLMYEEDLEKGVRAYKFYVLNYDV